MHDCRQVERKLIDLVFDEVGGDERARLLSEIEACPECLGEYSSVLGTVRIFDRAVEASLPAESFWPRHHEALRLHLAINNSQPIASPVPFWKRFLALRLHVPAPIAAMFVITLFALTLLAFRSSTIGPTQTLAAQPQPTATAPPRIIEVPVVHEKVVTRTVYVEKQRRGLSEEPDQSGNPRHATPLVRESEDSQNRLFTRASLTDYQPPDEMRIRIIKRSKSDEK